MTGPDQLKEQYFKKFDKGNSNNKGDVREVLLHFKPPNQELTNLGKILAQNFMETYFECNIRENGTAFTYLNDWVNMKKDIYTYSGRDCSKNELWNKFMEDLWKKLIQSRENCTYCARSTTNYICSDNSGSYKSDKYAYTNFSKSPGSRIFFPIFGTFSIIFCFIYKFTTFGTWFNGEVKKFWKLKKYNYKENIDKLLRSKENYIDYTDNRMNRLFNSYIEK
ncbi:variable surface protein [Plasmodium gonderi]|uniref:Variable surface protein n=1 Tax=Plasmodium gonderi TaxID=77519 RepID=A0A1Y1JNE4_PLAGO|nr:variable surface protein [Plasmodium gonderi]GAW83991.1 variable surface protein [Plasmodium gonderi]